MPLVWGGGGGGGGNIIEINGTLLIKETYPSYVASRGSDVVYSQPNPPGRLGDAGTCLEGVVDAINAVFLHADEETRGELGATCSSIKESGRGMCEPSL